jgi:AcrR family transcriptional regulator
LFSGYNFEVGLRDQKKAATRQQISAVATRLFLQRGFDAVSVADVARAANVSKMTVFNYFPRKEDLMLDRDQEARDLLREAVLERAPRTSILRAVERLASRLVEAEHPFAKWDDGAAQFFETVRAAPSLVARLREIRDETERGFTEILEQAAGEKGDPVARVLASAVLAAWHVAYEAAERARLAGKRPASVRAAFLHTFTAAFAAIERAAKGTPYGARSARSPAGTTRR